MSKFQQYLEAAKNKKQASKSDLNKACKEGEEELNDMIADGDKITKKDVIKASKGLSSMYNVEFSKDQIDQYVQRMMNVIEKNNEQNS